MKLQAKQKAIELRKKGYSYSEILKEISVSKSTLSLWLKDVVLSVSAQKRLENQFTIGQLKSAEMSKERTRQKEEVAKKEAHRTMQKFYATIATQKIWCALLYWCEGAKSSGRISFTNSDPEMMKVFIKLFRTSFHVDEKKFRMNIHLHSYHDAQQILNFWSGITEIPLSQFMRPHMKKTSGMYKKGGYKGCATLYYFDVVLVRELIALKNEFLIKLGL